MRRTGMRWLVGLLLLATATEAWCAQRFRVLSTEVSLPARLVSVEERGNGALVTLEVPDSFRLARAVSGWRPDPILRQLTVEWAERDTARLLLRWREKPRCRLRCGRAGEATALSLTLVEPADADYYLDAGCYLASLGDLQGALEQYRKALALRPGDARAYLEAARVRLALGQRRLAAFNARKALADPSLAAEARALLAQIDPGRQQPAAKTPQREAEDAGVSAVPEAKSGSGASGDATEVGPTEMPRRAETTSVTGPPVGRDKPAPSRPRPSPGPPTAPAGSPVTADGGWLRVALTALILSSGIMAPIVLLMWRSLRKSSEPARTVRVVTTAESEFERTRRDVFERLLAQQQEAAMRTETQTDSSAASEPESAGPAQPSRKPQPVLETTNGRARVEPPLATSSPGAELRSRLESVYALADRGVAVPEIARRLGMGKEEVRLALEVRAASSWTRSLEKRGLLTFELVEDGAR